LYHVTVKSDNGEKIFEGKLEDYTLKTWRRFEVNGSKTMAELGYILTTMFEMQASHLWINKASIVNHSILFFCYNFYRKTNRQHVKKPSIAGLFSKSQLYQL